MLAARYARGTVRLRRYVVVRFAHESGLLEPKQVTTQHIEAWLASLNLAAETAHSYRAGFRGYFEFCAKRGFVESDPAAGLAEIRRNEGVPRPCPDANITKALRTSDSRTALMIRLAAEHGLRCAEIARAYGTDLMETKFGLSLTIHGKGGKDRTAFIDKTETELIEAFGSAGKNPVFPGQISGHLSPGHVSRLISRALPGAYSAHTLRSRFASTAYHENPDILQLQRLMGHSSPKTTLRYVLLGDQIGRQMSLAARIPSTSEHKREAYRHEL